MFNFIHIYADRCSQKENAFCSVSLFCVVLSRARNVLVYNDYM